jgi:hypothetical protein
MLSDATAGGLRFVGFALRSATLKGSPVHDRSIMPTVMRQDTAHDVLPARTRSAMHMACPALFRLPDELVATDLLRHLPVLNALHMASTCKQLRSALALDSIWELYDREKSGLREIELLPVGGLIEVGHILKRLGARLGARSKDIDDWMLSSREFQQRGFFLNVGHMEGVERRG